MQNPSGEIPAVSSFALPRLFARSCNEDCRSVVSLKIAFLCEIPYDGMIAFRQSIEDLVNASNGKLIYVLKSNNPIRLVSGEGVKYPSTHTPDHGTPGVVKDAKGNANRRLGVNDHSRGGSLGGPCWNVPVGDSASECLQECDRRERDGWCSRNTTSHPDRGSRSPCVRIRFPSPDSRRWTEALLNTTLVQFHGLDLLDSVPAKPSFLVIE
jgi:hypothetical protein